MCSNLKLTFLCSLGHRCSSTQRLVLLAASCQPKDLSFTLGLFHSISLCRFFSQPWFSDGWVWFACICIMKVICMLRADFTMRTDMKRCACARMPDLAYALTCWCIYALHLSVFTLKQTNHPWCQGKERVKKSGRSVVWPSSCWRCCSPPLRCSPASHHEKQFAQSHHLRASGH